MIALEKLQTQENRLTLGRRPDTSSFFTSADSTSTQPRSGSDYYPQDSAKGP